MPDDYPADRRHRPEDRIMQGAVAHFAMPGKAVDAADTYGEAFGAKDIGRMPCPDKPGVMHVQVGINGGALMLTDEGARSSIDATGNPMPQDLRRLVVPVRGGRLSGGGRLRTAVLGRHLGPAGRSVRAETGGVDSRSRCLEQAVMFRVQAE